jgi:F0F1-type ATP synthase membrane subunit b/b'
MAKFFHIEIPADYKDWMELITSSEKYTQRAQELKEYSESINKALTQYEAHKSAEDATADANAKLKEAAEIRKQADDYADSLKAKVEKEADAARVANDEYRKGMAEAVEDHKRASTELKLKSVALDTRKTALDKLAASIKDEAAAAKTQLAEAQRMKAAYEEKLKSIKAAIGE